MKSLSMPGVIATAAILAFVAVERQAGASVVSLAIPTYFAPSDTTDWNLVENSASKVSMVIVNPGNGPDPSQASAYQSLYATLHSKGIKVLGYVHTLGGCRPYHTNYNYTSAPDDAVSGLGVEGDINEWSKEHDVDGIFLDEGPGPGTWNSGVASFSYGGYTYQPNPSLAECSGTTLQYYQPLRAYTQSLAWPNGTPSITLNPGGPTDEQYLYDSGGTNTKNGVADVIVTAEEYDFQVYAGNNNSWLAAQFASGGSLYWVYNHTANHFWQLCYNFATDDIDPLNSQVNEVANSVAQAEAWNAQYVYYTDSSTPWSTMAGTQVWNDELWNSAGQLAPPAGGSGSGGGGGSTIYNVSESVNKGKVTFQYSYTGSWTYFHVFIDTDTNSSTGYTIGGIGADYLIENGGLYKSTANGSGWSWASAGSVTYTNSGGVAKFTLPLSSIGSPSHFNVVYQVATSSANYTTAEYSY